MIKFNLPQKLISSQKPTTKASAAPIAGFLLSLNFNQRINSIASDKIPDRLSTPLHHLR